jgi:hypothetical protein
VSNEKWSGQRIRLRSDVEIVMLNLGTTVTDSALGVINIKNHMTEKCDRKDCGSDTQVTDHVTDVKYAMFI